MAVMSAGPVQPLRLAHKGERPGILINNDTTKTLYWSNDTEIDTGSNILPPQAYIGFDGSLDIYGSTLGNGNVQVIKSLGVTEWNNPVGVQVALNALGLAKDSSVNSPGYGPVSLTNPGLLAKDATLGSPAQDGTVSGVTTAVGALHTAGKTVAGEIAVTSLTGTGLMKDATGGTINTTLGTPAQTGDVTTTLPTNLKTSGIPPINNHNQLLTLAATSLAIGGSNTSAAAVITQPAYEIYVSCFATAGGLGTVGHVRIDWSDSATGLVVDQDSFWVYPGTGSGSAAHVFKGRGPTKGNQAKIFVQTPGNSSAAVTFAYTFFQSSRLITTATDDDIWFTVQSPSLSSGPPLVSNDPIARVIASESISVAANSSSTAQGLPLYNGPVWIRFATTSGTTDAQFEIDDIIDPNINQDTVFKAQSDATGRINVPWRLPRIQCEVILTNQNAAAKTLSYQIMAP